MTHDPGHHKPFELTEYPLPSGTVVEASAGTGKTYSVAAYVTHALASDESLDRKSVV